VAAVSHIVPPIPLEPKHLRPATDLAERVLLPGDPGRALAVARELLDSPLMFNTRRGLWGYTGAAPDGQPVTIQSTGMGGPSAAIVVEELIGLGARTLVRIGTCGSLVEDLGAGDLVVAGEALAEDGTSGALGAGERVRPDPEITDALAGAAGRAPATVVSADLFYDPREDLPDRWRAAGAVAVEMEAAAIMRVAELRGVAAGCLLGVSDELAGDPVRIGDEALEALGVRLGEVALAALRTR
jgi:DeoD family purine-nucleoside phosphorylase